MKVKEKLKTFDDWKKSGRVVVKGEKGIKKNTHGKYLFKLEQTTTLPTRQSYNQDNDYYDPEFYDHWDDGADF